MSGTTRPTSSRARDVGAGPWLRGFDGLGTPWRCEPTNRRPGTAVPSDTYRDLIAHVRSANDSALEAKLKSAHPILVPVDGSDCSRRALEYADKRASVAGNCSLLVLNVQPAIPPSRFVSRAMVAEHQKRHSGAALKSARALLRRRKRKADISVRIGDPAATIIALAKSKGCSEIVMGTSGRGRVAGLLLGSVAAKVIQLAPCPVTVVK